MTVFRGAQGRHPKVGGLHDEKIQRKVQALLAITVVAISGPVVVRVIVIMASGRGESSAVLGIYRFPWQFPIAKLPL
jgi:hypothetical protein